MILISQLQLTGVVTVFAAATLVAGAPQQRAGAQTPPVYNVATEVTLTGTVDEVKIIPGARSLGDLG